MISRTERSSKEPRMVRRSDPDVEHGVDVRRWAVCLFEARLPPRESRACSSLEKASPVSPEPEAELPQRHRDAHFARYRSSEGALAIAGPTARSGRLRDREGRADENMAMSSVAAPLDRTFPPGSGGGHLLRPIGGSGQTSGTGSKAAGLLVDTPVSLLNGTCSRLSTAAGPPPGPHPPLLGSIANAGWLLRPT
jgi:hypothetical protein